ncbi:porin [Alcanivorax sp. 24]|uniref:porin n=1 Tax=Alcanivorax sp. 24 TaxID=2545266 RepID=UPI00105BF29B|nr:porin [Alcanivorax sp. 24]
MNTVHRKLVPALLVFLPASTLAAPQFYGRIDIALEGTDDYPTRSLSSALNDMSSGDSPLRDGWFVEAYNSYLGVRDEVPLDVGGLSLIYQFEAGYDVDGDSSDTFTTRNSYIGLATPWGRIFAGRYDSLVKQAEGKLDQFNNTGADMQTVFTSQYRNDNTLNWVSPKLGNLVLKAQIAPGEQDDLGTPPYDETKDGLADIHAVSAIWNSDALYAALAYEHGYTERALPAPVSLNVPADRDVLRGALGMRVGNLSLGAIVEELRLDPDYPGASRLDGTSYLLSAGLAMSPRLTLKAQGGRFDSDDLGYTLTTGTVGADYKLGAQTTAYTLLSVSDADVDDSAAGYDDGKGGLVSVGLAHKF